METLTQEEIIILKTIAAEKIEKSRQEEVLQREAVLVEKIEAEVRKIVIKYQPLLDDAEKEGRLEDRKALIESMALEARQVESEIRSAQI